MLCKEASVIDAEQSNTPSIKSCDLSDHDRSCSKIIFNGHKKVQQNLSKMEKKLFLPGIEPGTLSVLDSRDNHYTTRTPQYNA